MRKFKKKNRIAYFLIASGAIHVIPLLFLKEKPTSKRPPTKITKISSTTLPPKKGTTANKSTGLARNRKKQQHTGVSKHFSYKELLPNSEPDVGAPPYQSFPTGKPQRSDFRGRGKYSSPVLITKDQTKLLQLARELADYFQIPFELKKLEHNGSAHLRMKRQGGVWVIASVDGIPYYRAFLFESIQRLSKKSRVMDLIHKLEMDSFEIDFSFKTVSHADLTFKEISYFADSSTVSIQHMRQWDHPKYALVGPVRNASGVIAPAFNILAAAKLGYDALTAECVECNNPDLIRLRQSPAFSKPIWKSH